MGNCCSRNGIEMNEGIIVPTNQSLGINYGQDKTLTEDDFKILLKRMIYLEYNTKLKEKRSLQSQRNKELENGMGENYISSLEKSRKLDHEIKNGVEDQVLAHYNVDKDAYINNKAKIDISKTIKEATNELFKDIKQSIMSFGYNEGKIEKIKSKYQVIYDETEKELDDLPDLNRRISDLYDDDVCLNYVDVVTSDKLSSKYGLLPIEFQALIYEPKK